MGSSSAIDPLFSIHIPFEGCLQPSYQWTCSHDIDDFGVLSILEIPKVVCLSHLHLASADWRRSSSVHVFGIGRRWGCLLYTRAVIFVV